MLLYNYYTPMQTAEWIVEAPTEFANSTTGTIATLAPFSTVQFTNAWLRVVGKTHDNTTAIGQKYHPKNPVLINYTGISQTSTSLISLDGLSFSVSYIGSPATTSTISTTSTILSTITQTTVQTTLQTTVPLTVTPSPTTSIVQSSTTISQNQTSNQNNSQTNPLQILWNAIVSFLSNLFKK